ncbi:MAG: hypothetical protein CL928_03760, partial [Deltaproteobacteria bacterium]|nr:hypothetical protein [Deltaproteobacteria bacterium]
MNDSSPTTSSLDLVLALDSGSQSSRALLFDGQGQVLSQASRAHAPMLYPSPGAVEQCPRDIRDCLFGASLDCLEAWGGDRGRIAAVAITTQRATAIPVDADGEPMGDLVSWLDQRKASLQSERSRVLRAALRVMGEDALVPRLLSRSFARQWRERDPALLAQLRWLTPLEAWIHHQLCGRMALAPGGLVGAWPVDVKRRDWDQRGLLMGLLGFRREWLPEIVEAGREIGQVTAGGEALSGIPAGTSVISCGGDKQAEALGVGVRPQRPGIAAVSLGTASTLSVAVGRPRMSPSYRWFTVPSAEQGSWQLEYMVFRGFWTVAWFAREFARDLQAKAEAEGLPVEALLCREAESVPPGSDGLVTWPRWSPTLQHPEEVGTLMGLRETHGRAQVFRSLLEGIAFDLRRGRVVIERASGEPIRELRVGGGGSRSAVVVQLLADVLDLP